MGEELMNVQPNGTVTFANEVLETIAGIAVADVPGIANMSGSLVKDGWNDLIGKKRPAKGVKVTKTEDTLTIDVQIIVEYGVKVHEVCQAIQESVYNAIETMTGLKTTAVNVYVQGVKIKEAAPSEAADKADD
ncbi:MAG: Asp23/Gls24 family envelope stress response protein [Clostridiales bacterium]|nr:MAG: Asp23/Gls24 family envelope stress response protein [Clostridiales bacterium]PWL49130.1 MAG: Asp23/Gls24 family envelope stress response protein [Clostridiales bacterium]